MKGLDKVFPTRKTKKGAPPTITGSGVAVTKEKRFAPWNGFEREPNEMQKRIMLREGLRTVLMLIMKNHIYIFNKEIRM